MHAGLALEESQAALTMEASWGLLCVAEDIQVVAEAAEASRLGLGPWEERLL